MLLAVRLGFATDMMGEVCRWSVVPKSVEKAGKMGFGDSPIRGLYPVPEFLYKIFFEIILSKPFGNKKISFTFATLLQ